MAKPEEMTDLAQQIRAQRQRYAGSSPLKKPEPQAAPAAEAPDAAAPGEGPAPADGGMPPKKYPGSAILEQVTPLAAAGNQELEALRAAYIEKLAERDEAVGRNDSDAVCEINRALLELENEMRRISFIHVDVPNTMMAYMGPGMGPGMMNPCGPLSVPPSQPGAQGEQETPAPEMEAEGDTARCPICGAPCEGEWTFCNVCGAPLRGGPQGK